MPKLHLYNPETSSPESILQERAALYKSLSPQQKLEQLFALIETSRKLNNDLPLKKPQGKGIIISKPKKI